MNISNLIIMLSLFCVVNELHGKKYSAALKAKQACALEQSCATPKSCALKPRTRRYQCEPLEYGLDCDSCCYQAYTTPSYYGNAFRPYNGDGYFGRRPGNYNFAF